MFQNARGEFQVADSLVEGGITELISPVHDLVQKLSDMLEEIELKNAEIHTQKEEVSLKVSELPVHCQTEALTNHMFLFGSWDLNKCSKIKTDIQKASSIIMETASFAWDVTQAAATIGNNILNCAGWNPVDTVKCYNKNFQDLKQLVADAKAKLVPEFNQATIALQDIRWDFDTCLGIPISTKAAIDQHLQNC